MEGKLGVVDAIQKRAKMFLSSPRSRNDRDLNCNPLILPSLHADLLAYTTYTIEIDRLRHLLSCLQIWIQ